MIVEWLLANKREFLGKTYKIGGSQAVRLPRDIVKELGIKAGDNVFIMLRKQDPKETLANALGRFSSGHINPLYIKVREILSTMRQILADDYESLRNTLTSIAEKLCPFLNTVSEQEKKHFINLLLVGLAYIIDDLAVDALSLLYTELYLTLDDLEADIDEFDDDDELYIVIEEDDKVEVKKIKKKFIVELITKRGKDIMVFKNYDEALQAARLIEKSKNYFAMLITTKTEQLTKIKQTHSAE